MIGVARSLVSGGQRFPEGPTHMLPLLMRALPGVDPNDFSKCMVCSGVVNNHLLKDSVKVLRSDINIFPVPTDNIPVHCYVCDSCAFGGLFVCPTWKNRLDRGEHLLLPHLVIIKCTVLNDPCLNLFYIFYMTFRLKERCAQPQLNLRTLCFSSWTGTWSFDKSSISSSCSL